MTNKELITESYKELLIDKVLDNDKISNKSELITSIHESVNFSMVSEKFKMEKRYIKAALHVIILSIVIYRRMMSKAARACKGKSYKEKSACMNQYKIKGCEAAIAKLESSKSICNGDDICIHKIQRKIEKWEIRKARYIRIQQVQYN